MILAVGRRKEAALAMTATATMALIQGWERRPGDAVTHRQPTPALS